MGVGLGSPYTAGKEDSPMPATTPTVEVEVRISAELHAMLARAAALQGLTLDDFVETAVREAARRVIEEAEAVRLSEADSRRFAEALLSPPPPSPALERAFAHRRRLLMTE
jgi:uncharacterized protein (DUF1778 family)